MFGAGAISDHKDCAHLVFVLGTNLSSAVGMLEGIAMIHPEFGEPPQRLYNALKRAEAYIDEAQAKAEADSARE